MSITRHQAVGAYRRWDPPTFNERGEVVPPAEPERPAPPPEPVADTPAEPLFPPDFQLPTAEEIERMQEAAREEARAEGHAEGLAAGQEEGRRQGHEEGLQRGYEEGRQHAQAEAERFGALVGDLDKALTELDHGVAEELMALALALTRKMVRQTYELHPEAVLEMVRAALHELPQNGARIRMHPDDAALAREYLGEQLEHGGHRLVEDDTLTRGGCVVQAGDTQIDASIETRWRRVVESLGRSETGWDEPA